MSAVELGGLGGTGPADNRPLNDQEFQLLQRLLSDPLSFPLEFKSWLVAYLESSDMTLPMNAITGLQKTLGVSGAGQGTLGIFPAGLILPYGGDTAPTGAYICDGSAKNQSTDARLYTAIGVKYGNPGAGLFSLPDMRGRVPVGLGTNADVNTLGQSEGAAPAARTPKHRHTVNDPGHSHGSSLRPGADAFSAAPPYEGTDAWNRDDTNTDVGPTGISVGPAGAPLDASAYLTINFIIVR